MAPGRLYLFVDGGRIGAAFFIIRWRNAHPSRRTAAAAPQHGVYRVPSSIWRGVIFGQPKAALRVDFVPLGTPPGGRGKIPADPNLQRAATMTEYAKPPFPKQRQPMHEVPAVPVKRLGACHDRKAIVPSN
jgi:hypothetical protein